MKYQLICQKQIYLKFWMQDLPFSKLDESSKMALKYHFEVFKLKKMPLGISYVPEVF